MPTLFRNNAACPDCGNTFKHELWCPVVNENTEYAQMLLDDPAQMEDRDRITLHGWGVRWDSKNLPRSCRESYDPDFDPA